MDYTKIVKQIEDKYNDEVTNIYLVGSRLYGYNTDKSDYDLVIFLRQTTNYSVCRINDVDCWIKPLRFFFNIIVSSSFDSFYKMVYASEAGEKVNEDLQALYEAILEENVIEIFDALFEEYQDCIQFSFNKSLIVKIARCCYLIKRFLENGYFSIDLKKGRDDEILDIIQEYKQKNTVVSAQKYIENFLQIPNYRKALSVRQKSQYNSKIRSFMFKRTVDSLIQM